MRQRERSIKVSRSTESCVVKITNKRANPHAELRSDGRECLLALLTSSPQWSKRNFESAISNHSSNDSSTPLTQHSSLDSTRSLESIHEDNSNRGMDLDDQLEYEEAELNRIKRKQQSSKEEEKQDDAKVDDEEEKDEDITEEVVTAHAGHLWKVRSLLHIFRYHRQINEQKQITGSSVWKDVWTCRKALAETLFQTVSRSSFVVRN